MTGAPAVAVAATWTMAGGVSHAVYGPPPVLPPVFVKPSSGPAIRLFDSQTVERPKNTGPLTFSFRSLCLTDPAAAADRTGFAALPEELVDAIVEHLAASADAVAMVRLSQVCRALKRSANRESIWRTLWTASQWPQPPIPAPCVSVPTWPSAASSPDPSWRHLYKLHYLLLRALDEIQAHHGPDSMSAGVLQAEFLSDRMSRAMELTTRQFQLLRVQCREIDSYRIRLRQELGTQLPNLLASPRSMGPEPPSIPRVELLSNDDLDILLLDAALREVEECSRLAGAAYFCALKMVPSLTYGSSAWWSVVSYKLGGARERYLAEVALFFLQMDRARQLLDTYESCVVHINQIRVPIKNRMS